MQYRRRRSVNRITHMTRLKFRGNQQTISSLGFSMNKTVICFYILYSININSINRIDISFKASNTVSLSSFIFH